VDAIWWPNQISIHHMPNNTVPLNTSFPSPFRKSKYLSRIGSRHPLDLLIQTHLKSEVPLLSLCHWSHPTIIFYLHHSLPFSNITSWPLHSYLSPLTPIILLPHSRSHISATIFSTPNSSAPCKTIKRPNSPPSLHLERHFLV